MYEIVVQAHPYCEEAIIAFLEANQIQPAIKVSETGLEQGILFYLEESDWEKFKNRLEDKLREIGRIFSVPPPVARARVLEEKAWRDAWKRHARIYRFGEDLIVKPSWRRLRKDHGCPVISIDPRMAFGTGGHASTRLCIHHLRRFRQERPDCLKKVLDVGTGSGILAIAAVCFGAGRVVATDIEPEAIRIARENAERNGAASRIIFTTDPLHAVPGRFTLIMANIFASVLTELLEEFVRHLQTSGILIVSGLLSNQGREFVEKAALVGLEKFRQRHSGPWVSYAFEVVS